LHVRVLLVELSRLKLSKTPVKVRLAHEGVKLSTMNGGSWLDGRGSHLFMEVKAEKRAPIGQSRLEEGLAGTSCEVPRIVVERKK